jgi:hypothetical protein
MTRRMGTLPGRDEPCSSLQTSDPATCRSEAVAMPKWEYFWILKNAWGNQYVFARAALAFCT